MITNGSNFRYKLERGSLTAFKREARNIIERDLPLILHRDNIIKVFTDKVGLSWLFWNAAEKLNFWTGLFFFQSQPKAQLLSTKWCSLDNFGEKFKYWFQVRWRFTHSLLFCKSAFLGIRVYAHSPSATSLSDISSLTGPPLNQTSLFIVFSQILQHPYLRLFVCYVVILCNFLVFAEDPVSHSKREADIPVVGNVFSFVFTKYPQDWRWRFVKVIRLLFFKVESRAEKNGIFLA